MSSSAILLGAALASASQPSCNLINVILDPQAQAYERISIVVRPERHVSVALDGVAAIPFGADSCNLDLGPTEDEISVDCSHHMGSFEQASEEFARLHSYFQACLPTPLELSEQGTTRGVPQVWRADSWFEAEGGEITGGWRVQIEHYDLSGTPMPTQRVTLEITRH